MLRRFFSGWHTRSLHHEMFDTYTYCGHQLWDAFIESFDVWRRRYGDPSGWPDGFRTTARAAQAPRPEWVVVGRPPINTPDRALYDWGEWLRKGDTKERTRVLYGERGLAAPLNTSLLFWLYAGKHWPQFDDWLWRKLRIHTTGFVATVYAHRTVTCQHGWWCGLAREIERRGLQPWE